MTTSFICFWAFRIRRKRVIIISFLTFKNFDMFVLDTVSVTYIRLLLSVTEPFLKLSVVKESRFHLWIENLVFLMTSINLTSTLMPPHFAPTNHIDAAIWEHFGFHPTQVELNQIQTELCRCKGTVSFSQVDKTTFKCFRRPRLRPSRCYELSSNSNLPFPHVLFHFK